MATLFNTTKTVLHEAYDYYLWTLSLSGEFKKNLYHNLNIKLLQLPPTL